GALSIPGRPNSSSPNMAARRWKTCFSMSPATDLRSPAHEGGFRRHGAAHRRGAAAPLVSDLRILAAISRSLLLAHRADDPVGLHPDLRDAAVQFFCAGGRHPDWRGDVVGRVVPWPDRTGDFIFRGSLFAQSRASDGDAAEDRRIYGVIDDCQPDAHRDWAVSGDAA